MSIHPRSLAREILGHIHRMGHKEIARSYRGCLRLLLTGGGAGLITAGTVVLKSAILHSSLPAGLAALLIALDFVASFLVMQALGFKLATKQSTLLGAAVAAMRRTRRFAEEAVWGARTQLCGALGNLLVVIPAALAFGWAYRACTGAPFIDAETARALLTSLKPLQRGTLVYAAFTGCLLWWSTLAGAGLAHRFGAFSKARAAAGFNVCLGILLAGAPLLGKALRLPLDVRHFTLSGGYVALAVTTLGARGALEAGVVSALAGVLCIGFLNFSVGFLLAFVAASKLAYQPGEPDPG
jgi:site-specific recombinase